MNGSLVVDAGLAFHLLLPGQRQAALQALWAGWMREGYTLYAPTLWIYEFTSALCKSVHFKALTTDEGRRALRLATRLNVQLVAPDAALARLAFDWTLRLSRAAAYDSFYLALAETLQCELWTADHRLRRAASVPWVRSAPDTQDAAP